MEQETYTIEIPRQGEFTDGTGYMAAPVLEAIGAALIEERPDDFGHLRNKKILYLWKQKGGEPGGKPTLGQASLPNKITEFATGVDYIIWVAADHALAMELSDYHITAVVFHELLHCSWEMTDSGKIKKIIRPHDFEGFRREIEVFGKWRSDLTLYEQSSFIGPN